VTSTREADTARAGRLPSRASKAEHAPMTMHRVRVVRAVARTPHLRRVTVAADSLRDIADDGPDQRFKLLLPRPGQTEPVALDADGWYAQWQALDHDVRPVMRTYTVRALRPAAGELDIDMVVHGDNGPGSAWATRAQPGDRVDIYGSYAEYEAPAATDGQLLVGDHSALPAIAAILDSIDAGRSPRTERGAVLVQVDGPEEALELTIPAGWTIRWVHAPAGSTALSDAVEETRPDWSTPYAWVAGESGVTAQIRRQLVRDRGWDRSAIMFMGYWRLGGAIDED
jgi:NADPH-dependent ferric siderophore reductase